MRILDKIARMISPASARSRYAVAKYDAAQTTVENAAHWAYATDWDADREASPDVRQILRKRSRYESGNNPWLKGMISTKANGIIGTGPRLQVTTTTARLNDKIEADFAAWARAIGLAAKLRTMRLAQTRDGEAFAVLFSNLALATTIKIDLQIIEADCCRGDYRKTANGFEVDGIRYDQYGNPVAYYFTSHPGGGDVSGKGTWIPAENVIHLFEQERPGQHRGVPELTQALPIIALHRRYTLAMVNKMENSANISGVIQTGELDGDDIDQLEDDSTFKPFNLPRGAFVPLPRGYRLQSHMMVNPTESQTDFAQQVKLEVAWSLGLPRNVAFGDSSEYNYSSGRMDYQAYDKNLSIERHNIETFCLAVIMRHWLREWWPQVQFRRQDALPMTWFWDGRAHVDPVKEANAEAQRLATGTTTLAIECARQGMDWEAVQDQRLAEEAREAKRRKELGLPPKASAATQPQQPEEPDEPEEAENAE